MAMIALDIAQFRTLFPAFQNPTCYADILIETYWGVASNYVSDCYGGCYTQGMSLNQQTYALNLMTAHLLALQDIIASGQTPGIETGATIDKISVTMEPPPIKDQWQYWLNNTPYGEIGRAHV